MNTITESAISLETLRELVKRLNPHKLFRARPKRVEDLPEWARCCPEYTAAALAMGEMIIDRSRTTRNVPHKCPCGCGVVLGIACKWCDAQRPELIGVVDAIDGTWVPIDELEIDEKPISEELQH